MGITSLSDWTPEEFMNRNTLRKPQIKDRNPLGEIEASFLSGEVKVPVIMDGNNQEDPSAPSSVDWRTQVQ